MPFRVWTPQAVNGPVNDVSAPILMGFFDWDLLARLDPPKAAASRTAPAAATNQNRFTDLLLSPWAA
jgi:hypothetical protein